MIIEDVVGNEDEVPSPDKLGSSNVKSTHKSSKQRESPPAKKAQTEDSEAHKLRSCKVSHASWDEWGKCEESKKGPDYKQMRYLMFAPMSELELVIFEKCSFDQPPLSHPSPLRALDKPSPSSKTTYS